MDAKTCIVVLVLLIGAALAADASAQIVSKCPDGKGGHVYQDAPCRHGRAEREWDGAAHRLTPERQAQIEAERQRRTKTVSRPSGPDRRAIHRDGRTTASQRQASRCEAAKSRRKSELDRLGLRRTYDILRRFDEEVKRACGR